MEKADLTNHLKIATLGDVVKLQKESAKLRDSLRNEQILELKDKNNDQLARQLEEMKRFNEELKMTLKERETKIPEAFICPIMQDMMQSLHASKVLRELEVESNNEQFFSSVGSLLMENSSLKSLSIIGKYCFASSKYAYFNLIGFGCMNSDQFYKGLEDNSSLTTLDVRTFDNYNQREKIHDDFKRIVAALRKNPTVLRFEIRRELNY